ncbi:MAG: SPOR domain-containing protein [Candidatus Neomarinimicrobiota bacterium]
MKKFLRCWGFFFLIISPISAQDINLYLSLLERGHIREVQDNIPELLSRYPYNPGIKYIQALVTLKGDSSYTLYREIIDEYPNSSYASEAALKIGEYLFARGLYSQSSTQLKEYLFVYPRAAHHQRALDLMVNSLQATGEETEAVKILKKLKQIYPGLDYNKYGLSGLGTSAGEAKLVKLDPEKTITRIKAKLPKKKTRIIVSRGIPNPWVVQVGAFGKYDNAKRLQNQLKKNGYKAVIQAVNSNGRRLHTVRVVRFDTRAKATEIGRVLKQKFGLDFRVINKPG